MIRHQELYLSLIIVHFQVVYIPRAWHYMSIQVFQKVGSYAGYESDTIRSLLVWSELSPCRVPCGAQDLPQYQIPWRQWSGFYLGVITLLELLLIISQMDHRGFPSFVDEVQALFQKFVIGSGAEGGSPLCWEVHF